MKTEIFCNIFLGFCIGTYVFLFGFLIFDLVSDFRRISRIEKSLRRQDKVNEIFLKGVSKWES